MTEDTESPPIALLRGVGLRVTQQRLAVLDALARHPHAGTDVLIAAVRKARPVSHQAVYDVLHTLADQGLVRRIQPAGSVARYELRWGTTTTTWCAAAAASSSTSIAPSARHRVWTPRNSTYAPPGSCCTRPRSPTGGSAPPARDPSSPSPT